MYTNRVVKIAVRTKCTRAAPCGRSFHCARDAQCGSGERVSTVRFQKRWESTPIPIAGAENLKNRFKDSIDCQLKKNKTKQKQKTGNTVITQKVRQHYYF